jgi:hypothetical protein
MSNGPRSYLAELVMMGDTALPLPPPTPPRPPTLIGPDKWWNPFSPSWPPTAAGRAAVDAGRDLSARAAETQTKLVQELANIAPDPIIASEIIVGKPTWGYYVPTVGVAALSLAIAGGLAYAYKKRK